MPRIKEFDAGPGGLNPSEAGSAAFREAGGVARSFANQTSEQTRLMGSAFGRAISGVGGVVGDMFQAAQDHVDTAAELEATKNATANDLEAIDAIQGFGTGRKDQDGNPDPSINAYHQGAGDVIEQYQEKLAAERELFSASGASEKAQDRFARQQQTRLRAVMIKAHSEAQMVAGQEALGNVGKAMNTSAALVDRHPEMLDSELGRFEDTVQAAARGMGKIEAKQTLGPQAVQAKGALITASIFSYARSGQLDQVDRILNDPKYDQFIGQHRSTIEAKVQAITHSRIIDQNAKDKAESDAIGAQQDTLIDQIYRNSRLPPDQQNPNLTRSALETSPLFLGRPGDLEKARKTLDSLQNSTIDPTQSKTIADGVSRGITDGTITTPAQIDAAYRSGKVTWQDRTRLQTELKDAINNPATKEFHTAINEWLKRNEGAIDRNIISASGVVDPLSRSELGQQMVSKWEAEVKRRAQAMRTAGQDPHSLLDPNSPNSMVTPQALAQYRVTRQMEIQYQAEQKAANEAVERARGLTPKGDAAPVKIEPAMTPDQVIKNYPPGTRVILPDGKPGVVPGFKRMNFAPERGATPAQQAINEAIQPMPDAHLDKNLFSSGRAQQMGIKGGVGANLTTIAVAGKNVTVNAQAAPHFKAFLEDLASRGYKLDDVGGYSDRMKAGSFSSMSEHAYGNAIDINPSRNPFRTSRTDLPPNISQIAAKYGLIWGGDWAGRSVDPMHFEWSGKGGATQFASK